MTTTNKTAKKQTAKSKQTIFDDASYYGLSVVDYKAKPGYTNRKGMVYAIIDRRTDMVIAIYSTSAQVKAFLKRFLIGCKTKNHQS